MLLGFALPSERLTRKETVLLGVEHTTGQLHRTPVVPASIGDGVNGVRGHGDLAVPDSGGADSGSHPVQLGGGFALSRTTAHVITE